MFLWENKTAIIQCCSTEFLFTVPLWSIWFPTTDTKHSFTRTLRYYYNISFNHLMSFLDFYFKSLYLIKEGDRTKFSLIKPSLPIGGMLG